MAITISIILIVLVSCLALLVRVVSARQHAEKANGTYAHKFVLVKDDGSVRCLKPDELDYLNTEFIPGDGARPYVKSSYAERTADGRISGFLLRRKVPSNIPIKQ